MSNQHDEGQTGGNLYEGHPREVLARLGKIAGRDDAVLPTAEEMRDVIAYLSMSKQLGNLTYKQMDAFWELNRRMLNAEWFERNWYREHPAYDMPEHLELPEDDTARHWFDYYLERDQQNIVLKAAYVQFKHVLEEEPAPMYPGR